MSAMSCISSWLAQPNAGDMLVGDHRIAERIVLVIIFDDRARQLRAFLDPEPLRQRAGGDVADDHLDRHDLDLADQLLAHVEAADEVRRHADLAEQREDMLGNAVVEHALAVDRALLLGVERGRVVLEILDQRAGLGTLVEDLGLAFVDLAAAGHAGNTPEMSGPGGAGGRASRGGEVRGYIERREGCNHAWGDRRGIGRG